MPNSGLLPVLAPDLLMGTIAAVSDLTLVVDPGLTVVQAIPSPASGFISRTATWPGAPLLSLFSAESARKLETRLTESANAANGPLTLELNHSPQSGIEFPLRYTILRSGPDGGLLLLGRDLRQLAEVQQRLVEAQLALERDYEAKRELETRYRVLMELSAAPLMIVSASTGRIVDLNGAAEQMVGAPRAELIDAPIAQEFEGRRRGELLDALSKLTAIEPPGPLELTVRRTRRRVQVTATQFRAAGDRLLLCRVELSENARDKGDDLTDMLSRLFHNGMDGIVFLDADGTIKVANEAFLNLTDSPNLAAVAGRPLSDFLSRGEVDMRVLLDNVKRVGRLRHYATRLNTDFGGQLAVEISASWFPDRNQPAVALVVRDASAAEGLRWPAGAPGNEGLRNVMQLVGYSALKDIVAETTEIIEKMCIETALELTGNNRVAAAELLSLSRQSLYVKLRKFNLLARDAD
ncbi:MAG: transcriptional regulator PpsR [Rhodobacterales bacterium]|nr:transcriptional regulator PpsR [Rhodobacterales bacterium]